MKVQASHFGISKIQHTFFQCLLQGLFSFTLVTTVLTCLPDNKSRCVFKLQVLCHSPFEYGRQPKYYKVQEPPVSRNHSEARWISSPRTAQRTTVNSSPLGTSVFIFQIMDAPTPAHEAALRYCAYLASHSWTSSVQVRVKVIFRDDFGDENTLGDARATSGWFIDGFAYPVAMVKSILHEDVNANDFGEDYFDIIIRLNSRTTGTSVPTNKPRMENTI